MKSQMMKIIVEMLKEMDSKPGHQSSRHKGGSTSNTVKVRKYSWSLSISIVRSCLRHCTYCSPPGVSSKLFKRTFPETMRCNRKNMLKFLCTKKSLCGVFFLSGWFQKGPTLTHPSNRTSSLSSKLFEVKRGPCSWGGSPFLPSPPPPALAP